MFVGVEEADIQVHVYHAAPDEQLEEFSGDLDGEHSLTASSQSSQPGTTVSLHRHV